MSQVKRKSQTSASSWKDPPHSYHLSYSLMCTVCLGCSGLPGPLTSLILTHIWLNLLPFGPHLQLLTNSGTFCWAQVELLLGHKLSLFTSCCDRSLGLLCTVSLTMAPGVAPFPSTFLICCFWIAPPFS